MGTWTVLHNEGSSWADIWQTSKILRADHTPNGEVGMGKKLMQVQSRTLTSSRAPNWWRWRRNGQRRTWPSKRGLHHEGPCLSQKQDEISSCRSGVPSLRDLMPKDMRKSWCDNHRNNMHNKWNVLESFQNHPSLTHICGKIVFHKTSPWVVKVLDARSCPALCDPMDCSCQAPQSMGFSRQEYWSGLPFPSPGDLPDSGIKPGSPELQEDSLLFELHGKPPWVPGA